MTQPTDEVQAIASDAVFDGTAPLNTQGEAVRIAQSDADAAQGHIPGESLKFQHLNDQLYRITQELLHRQQDTSHWCGDASDGDDTNAGTLTLTRDVYYDTLTNNGTIALNGYRLFARTLINNGTIHADGEDGADAVSGAPDTAGAGGAGCPNGSVGGGTNGGDGAEIGGLDGGDGGTSSNFRAGSLGSDGDAGSAAEGAAGTCSQPTASQGGLPRTIAENIRGYAMDLSPSTAEAVRLQGGTGGGGGGSNVSDAGGGGGGGGGFGVIVANDITNAGTIRANGGAGGAGTQTNCDGGAGGAGALRIIYRRFTDDSGTIQTLDGDGTDQSSSNVMMIRY